MKKLLAFVCVCVFFAIPLFAQTHTSVTLESQVYYLLEQAEIKGLCAPLSGVKPYTRSVVITAIDEILATQDSKKLNDTEREILQQYRDKYTNLDKIISLRKGIVHLETAIGKNDMPLSLNIGASVDLEGSIGLYNSFNDKYWGTDIWVQAYLNGDLGRNISYELSASGGLIKAPREFMGKGHTYYDGFTHTDDQYKDKVIEIYSEPLTHFPYTYKKRWDGSVFFFDELDEFEYWPDGVAGGYNLLSELTASFLENKLILRLGRLSHEWSSTSFGSSLAFNQMARPFLGFEAEFNPVSWLGFASLTGILEYNDIGGIKISSSQSQNAFSMTMLQLKYKDYVFFDFIDSVVWPKRFELGYISPITNSFFYQNNIGDFDNMAIALNLKGQYPGLGSIWVSAFIDEINLTRDFSLDRQMFAMQSGVNVSLPFLAFSSIKLSYTKVNPYNYTHNRNFNPWYSGEEPMETSYTNNGVSLGYYLPPNSDEILFRFQTMPVKNLTTSLQYQLIRHGADFGSREVDGGNLRSELDPDGRDTKPQLRRYFLQDGAYQWMHIIRVGAEWNLPKFPAALYGEAGAVISYFTDIDGPANSGKPYDYSKINTPEYPESTGFIVKLGVKLYPR